MKFLKGGRLRQAFLIFRCEDMLHSCLNFNESQTMLIIVSHSFFTPFQSFIGGEVEYIYSYLYI